MRNSPTAKNIIYPKATTKTCAATNEACVDCNIKYSCHLAKEQLAFYNKLGITTSIDELTSTAQLHYIKSHIRHKIYDSSWNYENDNTRAFTHNIHSYPAMMIPQVAGRLLDMYAAKKSVVLDPFCGSGSVLLESLIRGYDSYGIDINPLALLISKVKTTALNYEVLQNELERIIKKANMKEKVACPNFFNIEYWFKPQIIESLTKLKTAINCIKNNDMKDFFRVVFSLTVRLVSNTRNSEFKLYRIENKKLVAHNPNVFQTFRKIAEKNITGMADLWLRFKGIASKVNILKEDTRNKLSIANNSIDIVITSPPYGDSKTTVAYGQFSRLSLQWLDFEGEDLETDKRSLGGILDNKNMHMGYFSPHLRESLEKISLADRKRARDVIAFYIDLFKCFMEIGQVVRIGGYLCMVVGNRTVKSVQLPTDEIVADFGESVGFKHVKTIIRKIPNKRMPSKNSPTNKVGILSPTMTNEFIVIMERC